MKILFGHILPNAVLPPITILVVIGWLLGGVAVIEMSILLAGLEIWQYNAITMRDYPLIELCIVVPLAYVHQSH